MTQWEKGYFPLSVISLLSLWLLVEIVATFSPLRVGLGTPGSTEPEKGGKLMLVITQNTFDFLPVLMIIATKE